MSIIQKREQFESALSSIRGSAPDTKEYNRLSTLYFHDPLADELKAMDPFSPQYSETAMRLYLSLRGRPDDGYRPEIDELTKGARPLDIWQQATPWSFRSPRMSAEFLMCWGHIMKLMNLPDSSSSSVLEYGPGSGQLLLFLARMGVDVYAVDIDQPSLDLVFAQAEAMGLAVKCERALFGEGFSGKKFDRIIFFEAFHHAWDFEKLMDRLKERLNPGGLVILCGEPVAWHPNNTIPFPWGPRLDGLSIWCMRQYGWMELGFTKTFLVEAFQRHGWFVTDHHVKGVGRATAFVASLEPRANNASLSSKLSKLMSRPDLLRDRISRFLASMR